MISYYICYEQMEALFRTRPLCQDKPWVLSIRWSKCCTSIRNRMASLSCWNSYMRYVENEVVNALSRRSLFADSQPWLQIQPTWISVLIDSCGGDTKVAHLITWLVVDPNSSKEYILTGKDYFIISQIACMWVNQQIWDSSWLVCTMI